MDGDESIETSRCHVEETDRGRHAYTVTVGGTMDGDNCRDPIGYGNYGQAWQNNRWLRLENIGEQAVKNPWVTVGGRGAWRSLDEIVAAVVKPGMSEAEKARALWEFARRHRYHFTTGDDEVKDTVKMLHVYGYTLCWDEAHTVANLWRAAGLKIRRGLPHGHCTTEVFYDGAYHLMDSDEHLLVLDRDNRTVVDEAAIARDHDLLKRSHAYGILSPENRRTGEAAAALFIPQVPGAAGGGERAQVGGHRMELQLRPGEALVWGWEDRGLCHGPRPPRLCNGQLEYVPPLDEGFAEWAAEVVNLCADGQGLKALDPAAETVLCYRFESPYVLVGGRVEAALGTGHGVLEWSLDGQTWVRLLAWQGGAAPGVSLGNVLPGRRAAYGCYLRWRGHLERIDEVSVRLDLQMAPLALPALRVGDNAVEYRDESPTRRVRLTHAWQERTEAVPPPPVLSWPAPGKVEGTQFGFGWEAVEGADDYHFELSQQANFGQVLSPVFEKLLSRTPAQGAPRWRIPEEGLLNPGQTYYWRVRARGQTGLWGPWSPGRAVVPQGPGVPLDVRLEMDWDRGQAVLRWRPNPEGRPPCRYEVYGSDERGFSARRRPYACAGGAAGTVAMPANLLATVGEARCPVVGAGVAPGAGNRVFYRVVAVDARGVRSGASDYAEMPRPFIYSSPPRRAVAGRVNLYQIKTLRSSGDLRCISRGPSRYAAAFRDADAPRFLLDEGPAWIDLDEVSGLMTMCPPAAQAGFHTVTVRVGGPGGYAVQGFDLEVSEA